MKTILLLSLLLPLSLPVSPVVEVQKAVVVHADARERIVASWCVPPAVGDWVIATDCLMFGDRVAPGDVVVLDGVTLQVSDNASLDIDFALHKLVIGIGSRVLIGTGARIH